MRGSSFRRGRIGVYERMEGSAPHRGPRCGVVVIRCARWPPPRDDRDVDDRDQREEAGRDGPPWAAAAMKSNGAGGAGERAEDREGQSQPERAARWRRAQACGRVVVVHGVAVGGDVWRRFRRRGQLQVGQRLGPSCSVPSTAGRCTGRAPARSWTRDAPCTDCHARLRVWWHGRRLRLEGPYGTVNIFAGPKTCWQFHAGADRPVASRRRRGPAGRSGSCRLHIHGPNRGRRTARRPGALREDQRPVGDAHPGCVASRTLGAASGPSLGRSPATRRGTGRGRTSGRPWPRG